MKRFNATIAKEKISKLREKYSKSVNQEEAISSSESLISVSSHEQEKHFQEETTIFENQPTRTANVILPYGTNEDINVLKADLESYNETNVQENKINLSDNSFEKPLSSGSLVLSDLSNQFERIRFISSSSEDLSIVESRNSQTESISTDLIPSVLVPQLSTKLQNIGTDVRRDFLNVKNNDIEIFNNVVENVVQEHLKSETESSVSKMSSIKELTSVSETGSVSDETSLLGSRTQYSDTDIKSYKKMESLRKPTQKEDDESVIESVILNVNSSPSILEKTSLVNRRVTQAKETGSEFEKDSDHSNYSKGNKSKNNHTDGEVGIKSLDKLSPIITSPTTYNKYSNRVNKGTNTDPVKVVLLKNKPNNFQHKSMANVKHALVEKTEKRKHIRPGMKSEFRLKQPHKKQFIKPCGLIRMDVLGELESNIALQNKVQSLKYTLSDDLYYNLSPSGALQIDSDEVINQLLKNQIKLTRHFISSHHDMYLQVCQAAQLLNEKYSSYL